MSATTDKFRDKTPGDKFANLFQNAKLMPGDFNIKKGAKSYDRFRQQGEGLG